MSPEMSMQEFVNDPDTVDFMIREGAYLTRYAESHPYVRIGPSLMGNYAIAHVNRNYMDQIERDFGVLSLSTFATVLGLLDRSNLEAAGIAAVQNQPYLNLRGEGVLLAFIDTGIDYTNTAFQYEDGTSRIQFLWDQSASSGTPPDRFYIGAEYTQQQINEALLADDPYSVVPQRDTVGHGTFLASVAASRESGQYIGAAPEAELIVVKLKQARLFYYEQYLIPSEQKNAFESTSLVMGLEYIYTKARELDRPVSICIGIGTNFGGHDGTSMFEHYLGDISARVGVCLCTAAGNESTAQHHMQGSVSNAEGRDDIEIRVGENGGNIFLTIWNRGSDRFSVSLKSPTGELVGRVPAKIGSRFQTTLILERATISIEYFFPVDGSGAQNTRIKITNATPGVWTITMHGDIILNGTYHAWLPLTGFIDPDIVFLRPSPNYTVVNPGTTIGVITCGAYNSQNNSLYPPSSWGPTRSEINAPDLVAPGVNVGGIYPTGYGTMSGTSVSAAITAGACALMLQWGITDRRDNFLNTYRIKSYLIRGCTRDQNVTYPDYRWGYGKLNLYETFNLMRET